MNPIAFKIWNIDIYWYGICIAILFVTGYSLTRKFALKYEANVDIIDDLLFKLVISAIVGGRLGAVVINLPYYLANPLEIFGRPGMGLQGAIILCMIVGYFLTKKHKLNYWQMADAAAPVLPLGHILVRIGNFINGELLGSPTTLPWAVTSPITKELVHPVQLYEALISLVIFPFALKWSGKPKYPGYSFLRVMLIHSVVRFFMDFLRPHSSTLIGPLVLTQLIALGFALGLGFLIWKFEKNAGSF